MKIIDLTLPLYNGMPVYPGDLEIEIELIQNFKETAWNMRRIHMNLHDGTHINLPIHGLAEGKSLNDYEVDDFIGESYLYENDQSIKKDKGIIFNQDITWENAHKIAEIRPKFVGSWAKNDIDIDIEKYFFEKDILIFERLTNTDKLPKKFIFHGVPLNIRDADGSPIRAYAIIN